MNWLGIILALVIIIIIITCIIIFTRLYIQISYEYEEGRDNLTIGIRLWHFIEIERDLSLQELKDEMNQKEQIENNKKYSIEGFLQKWQLLLNAIQNLLPIVNQFFKKLNIHSFQWNTTIGAKDASVTGIATGALWGIKGGLIGIISKRMKLLQSPEVYINPNFQKATVNTSFRCMISFKIGQAIYAFMRIIRNKDRIFKATNSKKL